MRIHWVQHVDFEDLGIIGTWAETRGCDVTSTRMHRGESLPDPRSFDWLIIMGGPMNIYEDDAHPWLAEERRFIAETIEQGHRVLGICLGAQFIADALGGPVTRNPVTEIGWHEVTLTEAGADCPLFADFPARFTAFQWHGDTFAIPQGAVHVASSDVCPNQALAYDGRVVGLQFHLESEQASVDRLLEHCADELKDGPRIQSADAIRKGLSRLPDTNRLMASLLDKIAGI